MLVRQVKRVSKIALRRIGLGQGVERKKKEKKVKQA